MSSRSAIYFTTEAQRLEALNTIAGVNASGLWPIRVVTEWEQAGDFWEAEPEHQDYVEKRRNGNTRHFPRVNWVLPPKTAATVFPPIDAQGKSATGDATRLDQWA